MAKKIGNLAVVLSADHSSLSKALKRSKGDVLVFGSAVRQTAGFAIGKIGALGAALGVTIGAAGLMKAADAIDHLGDQARRLGVTTEALGGFHYGAKLAGIEADEFDASLRSMTKNVQLAAQGSGKAAKAIADLGLDAKALAKLTPENQMKVFAEALSGVEDHGRATADAMRIFGTTGQALLPIFAGGAAGLNDMQTEAEALGLTMSAVDVSMVDQAKDSLDSVQMVLGGIVNRLAVEVAPYVKAAADAFLDWSKSGRTWGDVVGGAVDWVIGAVAYLADVIDLGKVAWEALKIGGTVALMALLTPVNLLIKGIAKLVDLAADYLPQSIVDAAKDVDNFRVGMVDALSSGVEESAKKINDLLTGPSASDNAKEFFKRIKKSADDAAAEGAKSFTSPDPYTMTMFEGAKATTVEMEKQLDIAGKVKDASFGENRAIRAGSAEAQSLGLASYTRHLDESLKRQIDLANEQLKQQAKIEKNTRPDLAEDEELTVIDG